MNALLHDLRFAVRQLRRNLGFTFAAVLTLALGIGANAAIFSVVRGVLLTPLPNSEEARIVYLRQSANGVGVENALFSVPEIRDLREQLKTISNLGEFSTISPTIIGLGEPRQIRAGVVDGHFFPVMGLHPVLGRLLGPGDDGPNAAGAVVLTYRFWTSELQSDPTVIGRRVRFGQREATIVGVLEPSVQYPEQTQIIANMVTSPHHLSATMVTGREHRMTEVFGRLAPGAELPSTLAEVRTAHRSVLQEYPEIYSTKSDYQVDVKLLRDQITSRAQTVLTILLAASGLIFLIACANVANLVLARTVRRETELAVRQALGAGTWAVRRALLAESLVLCGLGAAVGVLIARPMVSILSGFTSSYSVRALDLQLDATPLWVGVGLALVAAILLAFVPRLPTSAKAGTRVTTGANRRLQGFAVAQVAASFILLAGAGALIGTLWTLQRASPGFDTGQVLAFNLSAVTTARTADQNKLFYRNLRDRLQTLPGVDQASFGSNVPWRDTALTLGVGRLNPRPGGMQFTLEGVPYDEDRRARGRAVSPGFFSTLGIKLVAGRDFTDADITDSERVVIISASMARAFFPDGQDPVNRHLRWTDNVATFVNLSAEPRRIVGVVSDIDDEKVEAQEVLTVYHPMEQEFQGGRLFVRTNSDPYALLPAIDQVIRELSPEQRADLPATLEDLRGAALMPERLNSIVFGVFAGVALLISIVGIGGVLAFSVSGRTREFGVRLAIGSPRELLLGKVLVEGAAMAVAGVVAGTAVGWILTRVAGFYMPGLQLPGILPLAGATAVLIVATVVAALIPAIRAASINPIVALKAE